MKALSIIFLLTFLFTAIAFSQSSGSKFTEDDLRKSNAELTRFYQEEKYEKALPFAEKSVLITQTVYGKEKIETADALKTLGYLQFLSNDKNDAENTLEKAFEIYEKLSLFKSGERRGCGENAGNAGFD